VKNKFFGLLLALFMVPLLTGCYDKVPAGNVGIKIYLLGRSKGVDHEVIGVGRYWIGMNEDLVLFPTFQQTYQWTASVHEGKAVDESFTFQTCEGLPVNTDIGVSYQIDPDHVSDLYQKFRKGPEEITDGFLRNIVRDNLNKLGSHDSIAGILGPGKQRLFDSLQSKVQAEVCLIGLKNLRIFTIGEFRLPATVKAAIDAKITATQKATQAQNELAVAQAEAAKEVATAEGQARANTLKQKTLTPELIQWAAIEKWDGKLPNVSGGAIPFINVK